MFGHKYIGYVWENGIVWAQITMSVSCIMLCMWHYFKLKELFVDFWFHTWHEQWNENPVLVLCVPAFPTTSYVTVIITTGARGRHLTTNINMGNNNGHDFLTHMVRLRLVLQEIWCNSSVLHHSLSCFLTKCQLMSRIDQRIWKVLCNFRFWML